MQKPRIYIDTSVIGGCFDKEFAEWSNLLFEDFISGDKIAVISEITNAELQRAPIHIQIRVFDIPDKNLEVVNDNDDIDFLAKKYFEYEAISPKNKEDALHIATATFYKVNVLVSWNFKHIVNLRRINLYNAVNLIFGYSNLEIRSPREVLENE
jgi:predicted nucleic acid-binding protein